MSQTYLRTMAASVLVAILLSACAAQPEFPATPTKTPDPALFVTWTPLPSDTPAPPTSAPTLPPAAETPDPAQALAVTETPTISGSPTATPPIPTLADGQPEDHYLMARPVPRDYTDYGDRTYPYGSTSGGRLRPHTGLDMANPQGVPVVAVADGLIEYAGPDDSVLFGPQPNFYGFLVVIRLNQGFQGRPVFALYGHLSEVLATTGSPVNNGDVIGKVGGTGVAAGGAHLHFEVRLDDPYSYTATRNPDLWIRPYGGFGTMAGRIVDAGGNFMRDVSITIRSEKSVRYTWTYAGDENNPSESWNENFTYGDLPEGWYEVSFGAGGDIYRQQVYIRSGRTSLIEFVVQ